MQEKADNKRSNVFPALVLVTGLLLWAFWPLAAQGAPLGLPPRPAPMDTPQPGSAPPLAGYIELHVPFARLGMRTVVQWQDGLGHWHDVEGWRVDLDGTSGGVGVKKWGVEPKDFNTGPFRWVVYDADGGVVLGTSQRFRLPPNFGHLVTVEASRVP